MPSKSTSLGHSQHSLGERVVRAQFDLEQLRTLPRPSIRLCLPIFMPSILNKHTLIRLVSPRLAVNSRYSRLRLTLPDRGEDENAGAHRLAVTPYSETAAAEKLQAIQNTPEGGDQPQSGSD